MVDKINRPGFTPTSFTKSKSAGEAGSSAKKSTSSQVGDQVNVSDRLENVLSKLLEEAPPVDDLEKVHEIRQAIAEGKYDIEYDQVASDLMLEYISSEVDEGNENGGDI